ncbi:hypothetical protein JCM19275_804 [Nonlabens ulvanivorans]|uniref:Uncharacterized protein n=1 Tax=Nonlabens ulvanivorans TaxID=906888 RepID=A0A090WH72_NONUL|nr:hypothetical protein JCM19275_804 [Nonlabens ulvanivorans]
MSCLILSGQESIDKTGLWTQYFVNSNIGARLKVAVDFQYRTYEIPDDFQQFIGRVSIGYQLKELKLNYILDMAILIAVLLVVVTLLVTSTVYIKTFGGIVRYRIFLKSSIV